MSQSDISYSCGSCGYPLNLTSSNRITSNIGSGYQKSIKKGYISFVSVDLSRFTQVDEDMDMEIRPLYVVLTLPTHQAQLIKNLHKDPSSTAFRRVLTKSSWKNLLVVFLPPSCTCPMITCLLFFQLLGCSSDRESFALKHVNLSYCPLVSDSGRARIQSCCQLEAVNVSHCRGVNGSGLGGFSPTSTHIDADSCKLEPEGIIGIVKWRTDGDEVHCGTSNGMPVA
ncbi:hypothetical protein NC653_034041 [Populus alba x Populus x berolinensis]|uniref:Uncharacterized protein n=1 Tax=Populus alba x Populus x berolinensis TaxID=444605 RepID=A0AAD6Q002_9ROSI|nr:hypothetical protein NC653_034041 [Populus alba x Populus x berolinensis]